MKRRASEIIRDLEIRIARLEKSATNDKDLQKQTFELKDRLIVKFISKLSAVEKIISIPIPVLSGDKKVKLKFWFKKTSEKYILRFYLPNFVGRGIYYPLERHHDSTTIQGADHYMFHGDVMLYSNLLKMMIKSEALLTSKEVEEIVTSMLQDHGTKYRDHLSKFASRWKEFGDFHLKSNSF